MNERQLRALLIYHSEKMVIKELCKGIADGSQINDKTTTKMIKKYLSYLKDMQYIKFLGKRTKLNIENMIKVLSNFKQSDECYDNIVFNMEKSDSEIKRTLIFNYLSTRIEEIILLIVSICIILLNIQSSNPITSSFIKVFGIVYFVSTFAIDAFKYFTYGGSKLDYELLSYFVFPKHLLEQIKLEGRDIKIERIKSNE